MLGEPHSDLAFLDFSASDNGNEAHAQAEQGEVFRLGNLRNVESAAVIREVNVGDTELQNRARTEPAGKTDVRQGAIRER